MKIRDLARTFLAIVLCAGLGNSAFAQSRPVAKPYVVPKFRHIEPGTEQPDTGDIKTIRFIGDGGFPPFSYQNRQGSLTGFNVAIAAAVCSEIRVKCEFTIRPLDQSVDALVSGDGDAILTGLRQTQNVYDKVDFTRMYYRSIARFAVRIENPASKIDVRTLAGKRIGAVAGSAHEAFLKAEFTRSNIRQFTNSAEAGEALRTGSVDAVFGDALQLMFWMAGSSSRECCRFAGPGFADPHYFSSGLSFAVRRDNLKLRRLLDYGLDRLQASGQYAQIFRQFFPQSPWR